MVKGRKKKREKELSARFATRWKTFLGDEEANIKLRKKTKDRLL